MAVYDYNYKKSFNFNNFMQFKIPKNNDKYYWTRHSIGKMKQYGLSAQRVLRVIRSPQRIEKGIVKNTIAVMQPASTRIKDGQRIWSREIWAMYQMKNQNAKIKNQNYNLKLKNGEKNLKASKLMDLIPGKLKIISAWIYPGISPKNNPIPEDILREIEEL